MNATFTDDYGVTYTATKIECRACGHTVTDAAGLAAIIGVNEVCPMCGDGALVFDGDPRPMYEEVTVTYDLDDEANWGYSYNVLRDAHGRHWFSADALEQYEYDWSEVDGIDFGVLVKRNASDYILSASYFRRDGLTDRVVPLEAFRMALIEGAPYWMVPEAWRPVRDSDFEDD
jgi:hypothetical protein